MNNFARYRLLFSKIILCLFIVILIFSDRGNLKDPLLEISIDFIGFFLILIGGFGRIWSSLYIEGKKTIQLAHTGPYSIMRNPLYVFSLIMLIGYCCGIKSIILSIILISTYIILYVPTILYEEKILLEKHGTEFQNYLDTTPRFFPRFSSLQKSNGSIEISARNIERVLIEIMGFIFFYGTIKLIDIFHNLHYIETYFYLP